MFYHISGGTTELLKVTDYFSKKGMKIEIIGGTKDISFGQLIDRIGVALGCSFPSGKEMDDSVQRFCELGEQASHVITTKGKGYRNAEEDPNRFHGTGPFDPTTGASLEVKTAPSYSEIFGKTLTALAEKDKKIVAVSAAMLEGTGLEVFKDEFPDRVFDVGIAEGHGVTFAAGLAASGLKPVVAIYSTFLQRAYDELMIDVCMRECKRERSHSTEKFALRSAGNKTGS